MKEQEIIHKVLRFIFELTGFSQAELLDGDRTQPKPKARQLFLYTLFAMLRRAKQKDKNIQASMFFVGKQLGGSHLNVRHAIKTINMARCEISEFAEWIGSAEAFAKSQTRILNGKPCNTNGFYTFHQALSGIDVFDQHGQKLCKWELWDQVKANPTLVKACKEKQLYGYRFKRRDTVEK